MADVGAAVERAKDKTQEMQARASAIEELTTAGSLEDFTSSSDDIDRQLSQIQQSGQVEDELSKMKAELGQPSGDAPKEIAGSDDAAKTS
jgi:phage shock protein A